MSNQEILEKAIKKAIKNGFIFKKWSGCDWETEMVVSILLDVPNKFYRLIFDHNFAKAFWKQKRNVDEDRDCINWWEEEDAWKGHLSKMVLEKEPLKYIEKFL